MKDRRRRTDRARERASKNHGRVCHLICWFLGVAVLEQGVLILSRFWKKDVERLEGLYQATGDMPDSLVRRSPTSTFGLRSPDSPISEGADQQDTTTTQPMEEESKKGKINRMCARRRMGARWINIGVHGAAMMRSPRRRSRRSVRQLETQLVEQVQPHLVESWEERKSEVTWAAAISHNHSYLFMMLTIPPESSP